MEIAPTVRTVYSTMILREDRSKADLHNTSTHESSKGKPGLMDKLNPKVDADGDGKRGFMS